MKKQFIILLAVVASLMAALFLAACSQPAAQTQASASADSSAAASEAAAESSEASSAEAESADAAAETASVEYKGIPTSIPADHAGRTVDMCASCHIGGAGGAAEIPADHFVNGDSASGELDGARNQCNTCHLQETA